jgi:quaternary ammonium compound-resistance protein SugE
MPWFVLLLASMCEIAWAVGLKTSEGFTRPFWAVFTVVMAIASFALLAVAMRDLPLGTAYAIWTGIGVIGAFIFGAVMMGEAITTMRVISTMLVVAGLVGLKLSS